MKIHLTNPCVLFRTALLAFVLTSCIQESEAQFVRSPLVSRLAAERQVLAKRSASTLSEPTTIRYGSSAQASNLLMPAILLGAPSILILVLIIKAMKGD